MLARTLIACAAAATLAGCGSGRNDALSNYGGIDGSGSTGGTAAPATAAPATGTAPATAAPQPAAGSGASTAQPADPTVPQPMKPGDPRGLTKEQLAAGVTPWDKAKGGTAPAAGEPYRVAKGGESIYAIARKMLGSEARWRDLYESNPGVVSDPDKVPAGTLIYPPRKRSASKKFRGITDGLD